MIPKNRAVSHPFSKGMQASSNIFLASYIIRHGFSDDSSSPSLSSTNLFALTCCVDWKFNLKLSDLLSNGRHQQEWARHDTECDSVPFQDLNR